ncbi:MAG TPA: hypothetical protein VGH76_27560 [Actinomycetospora sp.]|uniref:hypothetical protein n=1 Tax=Actinomycetospora sp. TaxID=1872135 RepID=UPI002F404556
MSAGEHGWGATATVVTLALASAALVAFVVVEWRGEAPMLDLALFANPSFAALMVAAAVLQAAAFAHLALVSVWCSPRAPGRATRRRRRTRWPVGGRRRTGRVGGHDDGGGAPGVRGRAGPGVHGVRGVRAGGGGAGGGVGAVGAPRRPPRPG